VNKVTRSISILALASLATLGLAPYAFAEDPYYSNEDGSNTYVDNCVGANFTVTIDGTEYSPGDVASGFSLDSNYSISAGSGVTVGWVPLSVVQGNYGHGFARTPLLSPGVSDVPGDSDWLTLNNPSPMMYPFYPSIFYAECPGEDNFAYIQTFPGLTLDQAGYAANLEDGVYLSDQAQLDSLGLDPDWTWSGSLVFAPMSTFRNAAYAFWANYCEDLGFDNPSAVFSFEGPLDLQGDPAQGVWAWAGWQPELGQYSEFASSFYSYSNGSELSESGIDDVFEAEVAPPSAPTTTTTTTTPKLATTGANFEWLMFAGFIALVAGASFLTVSRRKRTA
jgi:LPXTG-motif cell wall-anchored protein